MSEIKKIEYTDLYEVILKDYSFYTKDFVDVAVTILTEHKDFVSVVKKDKKVFYYRDRGDYVLGKDDFRLKNISGINKASFEEVLKNVNYVSKFCAETPEDIVSDEEIVKRTKKV